MFWPLILPFKITFWLLAATVALATASAPLLSWKRGKSLLMTSALGCVAFIPSCTGIMAVIDSQRFGLFQHDTWGDVKDERVECYLPPGARSITLDKFASGHCAKYSISETELVAYLDGLWERYGHRSSVSREELNDGEEVVAASYKHEFAGLGWPAFHAVEYHSPVQSDGGGAVYYFDPTTGMAYHRAGYW